VSEQPSGDPPPDYNGNFAFIAGPNFTPSRMPLHTTGGVLGVGGGRVDLPSGHPIAGGVGVVGVGGPNAGTGVFGVGGEANDGSGLRGGGFGVHGIGGNSLIVADPFGGPGVRIEAGVGVLGDSPGGNDGVVGFAHVAGKSGVFGLNTTDGLGFGVGGRCDAPTGAGVAGWNDSRGAGVTGASRSGDGVAGFSATGQAVAGYTDSGVGVFGRAATNGIGVDGRSSAGTGVSAISSGSVGALFAMNLGSGPAAFFVGNVLVTGNHTVLGAKSAAVPHSDGTHRLLYSLESPESWLRFWRSATGGW
jgi:hypothetical protein